MLSLLILMITHQNDKSFSWLIKEYGNAPDIIFEHIGGEKFNEINKAINKTDSKEIKFFLTKIVSDIKKFDSLDFKNKTKVRSLVKRYKEIDSKLIFLNGDINSIRKEILSDCQYCIKLFGEHSFFDLIVTTNVFGIMLLTDAEHDYTIEIDGFLKRFESSEWKDSPLLSTIIFLQCVNFQYRNKYKELLVSSRRIIDLLKIVTSDETDDLFTNAKKFELIALSKLGKHSEAITVFQKIGKNFFESNRIPVSLAKIYSSVADSYFELGKYELGESYQELALSKMHQFYLDIEHPYVIAEAKKLYKMLEKQGKKQEMRKIEERYNLKNTPEKDGSTRARVRDRKNLIRAGRVRSIR